VSRHALLIQIAGFRHDLASSPAVVLGVFFALFVLGALAVVGRVWAAVLLVPLAFVWALCNTYVEGPTLWAISWNHGVTAADLLSAVALLIAAWRLLPPLLRLSV
jgi:hypothetical protein